MTLDLDAIEARAQAATYGPWVADGWEVYTEGRDWVAESLDIEDEPKANANGAFIAAARTDVPALVAEIRRLRDTIQRVRGSLDQIIETEPPGKPEPCEDADEGYCHYDAARTAALRVRRAMAGDSA